MSTRIRQGFSVVTTVARVLTGRQMAGRGVTVFPDDTFLVSYPRSGNTWARFLIGNLIYQDEPTTFLNIESRLPEIYFNSDRGMRRLPRPRVLKSHECFQPHYPRVIYLLRDARDVAISFFHHNVKAGNIPESYSIDDFIPRFIAAEFDARWGSWSDHVLSWLCLRSNRPDFLLVRYEDLKADPQAELARIANFLRQRSGLHIDASAERLRQAIELSSPERMRQLEKQQAGQWAVTKHTRSDKPFVRTAGSGGWKSTLSPSSVELIESEWGWMMQQLGYSLINEASGSLQQRMLLPDLRQPARM